MAYIEQILEAGEIIKHDAKVHWAVYLRPAFFAACGIAISSNNAFNDSTGLIAFFFFAFGLIFFF
jgi:hypothetical protein